MFNHGRPICVFGPLLVSQTLTWPWLVYSFFVFRDCSFLEDLLPCDNAGKPDCFTLINHKIQLGGDEPGGTELWHLIVLIIVLILRIIKILQITIWCGWNKNRLVTPPCSNNNNTTVSIIFFVPCKVLQIITNDAGDQMGEKMPNQDWLLSK